MSTAKEELTARTVQGIYDRAQDLTRFPEIGQRYPASSRHVRILLYEHYRIILGVFHGRLTSPGISCDGT